MRKNIDGKLLEQFSSGGIFKGSEFYLRSKMLNSFVAACAKGGYAILGIDEFELVKEPDELEALPQTFDFTNENEAWSAYRDSCNSAAKRRAEEITPRENLFLAFTIVDESDWKELKSIAAKWNRRR